MLEIVDFTWSVRSAATVLLLADNFNGSYSKLSCRSATTTAAPWNTSKLSGTIKIDHNHPLYLHSNDTPSSSLIFIQLTGSKNYAQWSRSMALSLVGKNKIGFVDGRYPKNHFDESVHDQ